MVEIEVSMKIFRKQLGNLKLIFEVDTYAELKYTSFQNSEVFHCVKK